MSWEDDEEETKKILEENPFLCPICQSDNCVPPSGNIHSDVLFIGEFPGEEELLAGKPFVGPTGRVLEAELRRLSSVSVRNFRLCNIWQHLPNKNKDCFERGIKICLQEAKDKRLVVLVGADTVKYFAGLKVSEWNGLLVQSAYLTNPYVLAMVQPAVAFHGGVGEVRFALQRFIYYLELEEQNA